MNKGSNSKIKDNPSIRKMEEQIAAMSFIGRIYSLARKFGIKNDSLDKAFVQIPELKKQTEAMSTIPDRFNEEFGEQGWVASEMMNFDLMQKCVKFVDAGQKEKGSEELINYYSDKGNISWLLRAMNGVVAFKPRAELAEKAKIDHLEGRYHASIPVILMIIDGIVNDISETQTGFHASNTNLEVWDTIVGHSSGLSRLKEIFTKARGKTNTETLTIPFRNGILHGRDINYDNVEVAAKSWAALFAVGDWARAKQKAKYEKNKPAEKKIGWREHLEIMASYKEQNKLLEEWKPRSLIIGKDIPVTGDAEKYEENTPERKLVEFLEAVKSKNYGNLARFTHTYTNDSINKRAASMREMCKGFELIGFEIQKVTDEAPAITEIEVNLIYKPTGQDLEKSLGTTFRLINNNSEGEPTLRDFADSSWQLLTYGLYNLA